MKKILLLCTIGLLVSSCAPNVFYQLYRVLPKNDISQKDELLKSDSSIIYEDENCKIVYDFWGEKGNAGFLLYNKSDHNIYLNMTECFFVFNGIAYDYFQNREFTSQVSASQSSMYTSSAANSYSISRTVAASKAVSGYNYQGLWQTNTLSAGVGSNESLSVGASVSSASSKTSSLGVNIKEKEIVCIPPKAAKVISEYNLNGMLYRDCNLFLYPSTKKQIRISEFSEEESPFVFSNRISYTIDGTDDIIKMEHEFYVSEITNFSEEHITEIKREKFCEDEGAYYAPERRYFAFSSPYYFYIKYFRNIGRMH